MTMINMIMRTMMLINTVILIKLRTMLRRAIPSLKLIHNWSRFVLKYCLSVFHSHMFSYLINCELQLKHGLVYMVNVSVSRHGQYYCWKCQFIDCPVIFQSKVLKNSLKGVLKGFTLPNVRRKINDFFKCTDCFIHNKNQQLQSSTVKGLYCFLAFV